MDFWLVAAVAGAGYLSKYWQNIARDWDRDSKLLQSSSGDSNSKRSDSSGGPLRGSTNRAQRRGNVPKGRTVSDTSLYDNSLIDDSSGVEVASTSGSLGNYQDLVVLSVSNLHPVFSAREDLREYESGNRLNGNVGDDYWGLPPNSSVEEMESSNCPVRSRSSFRTKLPRGHFIKPVNSLESCLMAQLYKEQAEMEEYVLSSLPSPATPTIRPLFVTDGSRVISSRCRDSFSVQTGTGARKSRKKACLEDGENIYGVPPLPKFGSSDSSKKTKAMTGKGHNGKLSSSSTTTNGKDIHPQGSPNGAVLFCLGISIGIISSFMTSKREVDKLKESLKQSENLIQDLQEELEMKDSLTVKELANENDESRDARDNSVSKRSPDTFPSEQNPGSATTHNDGVSYFQRAEESSNSISKIEAELEAELERLGLNMNSSTLERKLSDVIELDPGFSADFAEGELRVDLLGGGDVDRSKSNKDGASTSTTNHSGNYAVSPRELSLHLHEVIQSRLEERVSELETALQNSQRKTQIMQTGRKKWGELVNGQLRYSSTQGSPVTREHNTMSRPLVMNLSGEALDAYNEAREELMKMSDTEEEDSPRRIYEDIPCSHNVFHDQDEDRTLGSTQELAIPEEKLLAELFPSNQRMQEEHISLVLGSNDTSNSREEASDSDDEVERELIKQIVERTKKGSPVVINAQRLLFSLDETEHLEEKKF